jgi:hypothetical protein
MNRTEQRRMDGRGSLCPWGIHVGHMDFVSIRKGMNPLKYGYLR